MHEPADEEKWRNETKALVNQKKRARDRSFVWSGAAGSVVQDDKPGKETKIKALRTD
jgi:hypothetical protein